MIPSVLCIVSMPSHLTISLFLRLCSAYSTITSHRKSAFLCWVPSGMDPPGNDADSSTARDVAAHRKLSDRFLSSDIQTVSSDWQDEWPHEQDSNLQVGHHEQSYCSMSSNRSYSRDTRTCVACRADVRWSTRAPSMFLTNASITRDRVVLTRSTARFATSWEMIAVTFRKSWSLYQLEHRHAYSHVYSLILFNVLNSVPHGPSCCSFIRDNMLLHSLSPIIYLYTRLRFTVRTRAVYCFLKPWRSVRSNRCQCC